MQRRITEGSQIEVSISWREVNRLVLCDLKNGHHVCGFKTRIPSIVLNCFCLGDFRYFRYFIDALIVANTITIAVEYHKFEWAFLVIFTIEIILKVYTYGLMKFLSSAWNW